VSLSPVGHRAKDRAVKVLTHYFRTAFAGAGLKWDADNEAEVEDIVNDLLIAAKEA